MASKSPNAALTALWRAVAGEAKAPRLPRDPFKAFIKLLEVMGPLEAERGFALVELPTEPDIEAIALAQGPERAELTIAVLVSELVPFRTPAKPNATFYVDPVADDAGHHRVYIRDEEELPGLPHGPRFGSIEEAAAWLTELVEGEADWDDVTPEDDWEKSPASGSVVIESILDASPSLLWRAVADGLWPEGTGDDLSAMPAIDHAAWRRAVCAEAMHQLSETRDLAVPASDAAWTPAQRIFLDNLGALKRAIDGELPRFILDIAADGAHPLHEVGLAWSSRYQSTRATVKSEPEKEPEKEKQSPKEALVAALGRVVAHLEDKELLEVAPGERDNLVEHLFAAAAEAENPEKMLRRLIGAMLDSDAVEELYGDEAQLREAIIKSFRA